MSSSRLQRFRAVVVPALIILALYASLHPYQLIVGPVGTLDCPKAHLPFSHDTSALPQAGM